MSDRVIYRRPAADLLATTSGQDTARSTQHPVYEALVVDVILDHTHPQYSRVDGYNVGAIKVRIFNVNQTLDEELLPWADPIDFTVAEMPLIGELVVIFKIRGNFFYTKKVPLAHRLQEDGMLKLNDALNKRGINTLSSAASSGEESTIDSHKFGEYFRPDSRIRQLKHFEGDVVMQGRMGNSIRFGSSKMDPSSEGLAPNVIIRAGQGKDVEKTDISIDSIFGLILEDINKDASSIWVVSDQVVPFEPTTTKAGSFMRSVSNPPQKFDKAQIILNSDRILLNSKKSHIMLFSNEGVHINSFKDTTIDTDSNIISTANIDILSKAGRNIENTADADIMAYAGSDILSVSVEKTSFVADKLFIGTIDDDTEPLVGGTTLSKFLARLILALAGNALQSNSKDPSTSFVEGLHTSLHVITPTGPGKLNPTIIKDLTSLYKELAANNSGQVKNKKDFAGAPFNSEDNFVMLVNESPKVELNEFENGQQILTENNKWILSESYYKVV
jgi:hypothetical protein